MYNSEKISFSDLTRRLEASSFSMGNSLDIAIIELKNTLRSLDNAIENFICQQSEFSFSNCINFNETVESFLVQIDSVLENAKEQTVKVCDLLVEQKTLSAKETVELDRIIIDLVQQYSNINCKRKRFFETLGTDARVSEKKKQLDLQFDALKSNINNYNIVNPQTGILTVSEAIRQQKIEEGRL